MPVGNKCCRIVYIPSVGQEEGGPMHPLDTFFFTYIFDIPSVSLSYICIVPIKFRVPWGPNWPKFKMAATDSMTSNNEYISGNS